MILILKQLLSLLETVIWETLLGIATYYLSLCLSIYLSISKYRWIHELECIYVDVCIYILPIVQIVSLHSPVHDIKVVNNSFSFLKITVNWEIFHPDPHWSQCVKMAPLGQ